MTNKRFRAMLFFLLFMALGTVVSFAQVRITGVVKDNTGLGMPGVNVVVKGTTVGTLTDAEGKFSINVKDATKDVLSFSMIGYVTQEIAVEGKSSFEITMEEELQKLDEVVVVGYGTLKKSDLTGAVSSVKAAELNQLATVNVQQAMQGRVAGVMVTSESGEPGSGVKVRVRGVGTINNSDPLYVVDGFPTTDISYINPSDIESMEILKDASATAIYGNRGANGVVLITTRRGKEQQTNVNFSMYTGIQTFNNFVDVLDATEFAQARLLATENKYAVDTIGKTNAQKKNMKPGDAMYDSLYQHIIDNNFKGTDWQREVVRTGALQNYSLSISGGGDKYKYDLSGSYYKEDGVIINTWLKKYFLRFSNQYQFTKRIKGEAILSYMNASKTNYKEGLYDGVLPIAVTAEPISPVYKPDGTYAYLSYDEKRNPVALAERMKNDIWRQQKIVSNFSVDVQLVEGLSFTSKFGADLRFDNPSNYTPDYYIGPKDYSTPSSLYINKNQGYSWNSSNYFNYQKNIGDNSLNLMLGQEANYSRWDNTEITAFDVPEAENLRYISNAQGNVRVNVVSQNDPFKAYEGETKLASFFGRINYAYASKYMLTASLRRDGSSKLATKKRWGTFPSFSLGWNLKQEGFLENVDAISALKLRGGYGVTGNQASVSDPYSGFLRYRQVVANGDVFTYENAFNPELTWELAKQQNYAVDFSFFRNQLSLTFDYYIRQTEDMIVTPPKSQTDTKAKPAQNIGSMENKGLEISLGYRNMDNEFKYEINGNISFMEHPKVTKLLGNNIIKDGTVGRIGGMVWTQEGQELARFMGYKTNGLITADDKKLEAYKNFMIGDLKIIDQNNDSLIDEKDIVYLGSANPDFTYGLNVSLMYKGFDFKFFLQGVYGNELTNSLYAWIKNANYGRSNMHSDVLKGYQEDVRENSKLPKLYSENDFFNKYFTDYNVEDASYIRLKNIQLGYSFSPELLSKVGVKNFRIYVSADNLFTITDYSGYDPEVGRGSSLNQGIDVVQYPISKKYMMGMNFSF